MHAWEMAATIPRPPTPPRFDDWPQAIRSAELLRGTVVPCGPGLRLAAWPETPTVRACALRPVFHSGLIAAHLTAAWIWGAARHPGIPLEFITRSGKLRDGFGENPPRLHRYRIEPDDTVPLGELFVTSPSRTLFDLLRAETFSRRSRLACRVLLAFAPHTGRALRDRLERHGASHPYHRRVVTRLDTKL